MTALLTGIVLLAVTQHVLTLPKLKAESVLYDGLNVFSAKVDDDENPVFERWLPSEEDLRMTEMENGVEAFKYKDSYEKVVAAAASSDAENIVELLIVVDKDFGDHFQQNRRKILDYWTVYMWDINLRYQTLKNVNISFQVVGVVVIKDKKAQPFIEEARGKNGKPEHGRILIKFSEWVYGKRDFLPKFDLAMVVEKTEVEWSGGRAFMNGACKVDQVAGIQMNTLSFNDDGNWNSITTAAHQIGHSLGAPNDDDAGCTERGYAMSENVDLKNKWFFSSCSDNKIGEFVKSDNATCLRRKDNKNNPILEPEFDSPLALSMDTQCKLRTGNDLATIEKNDTFNCNEMKCSIQSDDGTVETQTFEILDNTICGEGKDKRCFRGRCRRVGYLLKNVASGLCMRAKNQFSNLDTFEMVSCPRYGTPLDRIMIQSTKANYVALASPFSQMRSGQLENDDKCAFAGTAGKIRSDRCGGYNNEWFDWELVEAGNSQFYIMHKRTKLYVKPENQTIGSSPKAFDDVDLNNVEFKWTRTL